MAENSYEIPIYIKPMESGGVVANEYALDSENFLSMGQYEQQQNQQMAVNAAKSNANASKALALQMAGKIGSAVLNNYGNITGDYVAQQNIQTAISEGASLASAAALGWAGIAMYALDKGIQIVNYVIERKKNEREAAFKQQRVYATQHKS